MFTYQTQLQALMTAAGNGDAAATRELRNYNSLVEGCVPLVAFSPGEKVHAAVAAAEVELYRRNVRACGLAQEQVVLAQQATYRARLAQEMAAVCLPI
jgi:hypothetical protein